MSLKVVSLRRLELQKYCKLICAAYDISTQTRSQEVFFATLCVRSFSHFHVDTRNEDLLNFDKSPSSSANQN
jgi:hypothetical protein